MKAICKRLKRGADLFKSIIKIAQEQDLSAGVIVSLVGCISEVRMRLAGGKEFMYNKDHYEIVSATGTISKERIHIHISVSDKSRRVFGGHLKEGTIIDTTCEVVIVPLEGISFLKEYDPETGYNELKITNTEG